MSEKPPDKAPSDLPAPGFTESLSNYIDRIKRAVTEGAAENAHKPKMRRWGKKYRWGKRKR